jgi:hypothetical protein
MSLRSDVLAMVAAMAEDAERLAARRRELIPALHAALRDRHKQTGRVPALVTLERLDREIVGLLADGGFVRPLMMRSARSADAAEQQWSAPADADSTDAFVARWTQRLHQAGIPND